MRTYDRPHILYMNLDLRSSGEYFVFKGLSGVRTVGLHDPYVVIDGVDAVEFEFIGEVGNDFF